MPDSINQFVTLADYAEGQLAGFGSVNQGTVDELNKALGTTGTGGDGTSFADGTALRPESLEGTLKVVTFKEENLRFWRAIGKSPAYNTVEEYNVQDSYGKAGTSVFFEEGGLPTEDDASYERKTALVKFLGTTRVITHPMTLVRTAHGDPVARETMNGTIHLLRQLETALFYADSALNPLMFDGILKAILAGGHVIDMRGKQLTQDSLEDGAQRINDNYGTARKMFIGTKNISDLSRSYALGATNPQRIDMPANANGMNLGVPVKGFASNAGVFDFEPTTFLRPGASAPTAASSTKAPAAPTAVSAADLAGVAGSKWVDADVADVAAYKVGAHYWGVSSVGDFGESAVDVTDAATTVSTGGCTLTITHPTSGEKVRHYNIYRGTSATTMKFVKAVAKSGTTEMTWQDKNDDLPGTNKSFLLDMDSEQSLIFRQLAPMMKIPLATIAASTRFMILLYGMPIMYNPRRNAVYTNIGSMTPDTPIAPYSR